MNYYNKSFFVPVVHRNLTDVKEKVFLCTLESWYATFIVLGVVCKRGPNMWSFIWNSKGNDSENLLLLLRDICMLTLQFNLWTWSGKSAAFQNLLLGNQRIRVKYLVHMNQVFLKNLSFFPVLRVVYFKAWSSEEVMSWHYFTAIFLKLKMFLKWEENL